MVSGAGAPKRSHHVGEKTPPAKIKGHGHSKEVQRKKTRVKSVKPPKGK
jgi:hypothetical protein